MATTSDDNYNTKKGSNDNVNLTVTIGFAQIASTAVSLDGSPILVPGKDESGNTIQPDGNGNYLNTFIIPLGSNVNVNGKELLVVSSVERIQDNEDRTSVEINLEGGEAPKTFPLLTEKATSKGDTVTYDPVITFI